MIDEDLIWTEKSKESLLKTVVFDVTKRHSVSPDGLEGDYIVLDTKDWAIVIPEDGDDFLMVKQWRHGSKSLSTEFPGGVIEKTEKPEDGAARELLEETGYKAGKLTKLASINPNPALFSNQVHIFLAQDLKKESDQKLDEDEYVNFLRIPKSEVIANMGTAAYPHALMATALGFYLSKK